MVRQKRCGALNAKIESVGRRRETVWSAMLAADVFVRAADTVGEIEPGFGDGD